MVGEQTYSEYMVAIRAGDRRRAFEVVDRAFHEGAGLATIYLRVLQPALREVGRLWEEGEMSVADEHLATAITQTAMARLYDRVIEPAANSAPRLVAAGAEEERHEVGLRMVSDLLEESGWVVAYLGGAVPRDSLADMVRTRRPDVVALSATLDTHVRYIADAIRRIRRDLGDEAPLFIVGGRPFFEDTDLARRVGADLVARDAAEAVDRLNARFR